MTLFFKKKYLLKNYIKFLNQKSVTHIIRIILKKNSKNFILKFAQKRYNIDVIGLKKLCNKKIAEKKLQTTVDKFFEDVFFYDDT